jgi:hypothetical protein
MVDRGLWIGYDEIDLDFVCGGAAWCQLCQSSDCSSSRRGVEEPRKRVLFNHGEFGACRGTKRARGEMVIECEER